jgi:p-aminobenzoyl-glutamate transporter AbgT
LDVSVPHPSTGETIRPVNLISADGLHRILTQTIHNFTSFAPLGTVLVAMLGIGVAEGSGLVGAFLRLLVLSAPPRLLTFVIVMAGVLSNTASEVGYVLLVPLAATIFWRSDAIRWPAWPLRSPGVSGGYSANLLLGTIDPLLSGLSEEAARIIDPGTRSARRAITISCSFRLFSSPRPGLGSPSGWSFRDWASTEATNCPNRCGPWSGGRNSVCGWPGWSRWR